MAVGGALLGLLGALAALPGAARTGACLEAGPNFVAETTLVVLSFARPGSDEALMIERAIGGDPRWEVRPCADLNLWERIDHGDAAQLEQLMSRKIVLAVFPQGILIKHQIIPYERSRVSQHHEVPRPQGFEMCKGDSFDVVEACKRYGHPVQALKSAAAALYKLALPACAELEDATRNLKEALNELSDVNGAMASNELRDFMLEQRERLQKNLEANGCGPRDLNVRLLHDRLGAKATVLTSGVPSAVH